MKALFGKEMDSLWRKVDILKVTVCDTVGSQKFGQEYAEDDDDCRTASRQAGFMP